MQIARPLAASTAAALALAALGSPSAAAVPADRTPRPAPAASPLQEHPSAADAVLEQQLRRTLAARSARGTTTFSVKSSRAATPRVRAAAAALGADTGASPAGLAKLGWTSVTVPSSEAAATRARLATTPGVTAVSEAQLRLPDYTPNDTRYAGQQQSMMTAMQAPTAWDTAKGSGVTIAVLDGGFDAAHPDLASKVTATWDVVKGNSTVTDSPTDTVPGHGTAAASAAAAATNNNAGIAGAAPLANLLLIQVGDDSNDGAIFSDASAAGIIYAVDHGADIISMSYGATGTSDPTEADAVAYAVANDVLVVASAGNDGTNVAHYPAALPSVLAVGATSNNGSTQASWSTYGSWVDIAAPGESVPVALPAAADTDDGTNDGYSIWQGTSFSAPLVAGMAAVVRSTKPSATQAQVRAALTSTTKAITKVNSGFAHGLVQVANAASIMVDPTITAPAADAELTDRFSVSATSPAPFVRFSVDGTTVSKTIATSAGTASGTFSSYGLDGTITLRAQSCTSTACGTGTTVSASVTNSPPRLQAPDNGALVGTALDLRASSAGDAVKFLADGTQSLGVDKVAPFGFFLDTAVLTDGAHTITAVQCSIDGGTCDTAHPSPGVSITVQRLRPTVKVNPSIFSPNGDKRRDTVLVSYTYEQRQTGSVRVKAANGVVVRGPIPLGTKNAGTYSWTFDGKSKTGSVLADGTYTIEVSTTKVVGDVTLPGAATAKVRVDKTRPSATSVSASSTSFYPYVDGFRDTTVLGATSNEALGAYAVYITNSSGTRVRTITGGAKPAGRISATWNGKTNSGARAAAGTYAYQLMLQDVAGNQVLSAKGRVTISWKKLAVRNGTKTVTALGSSLGYVADKICNFVFSDARPGQWPATSVAYESRDPENCTPNGQGDVAFSLHQYTLPSAVKYGTVKVTTLGGGSTAKGLISHRTDVGEIDYVRKDGSTIGAFMPLAASTASHPGPTVKASDYLVNGRTIKWWAGSGDGNWYDIRDFTITWTYYVLV